MRAFVALTRLSHDRRPIVIGPWLGEVGFELLYWIPFLTWARRAFPSIAARSVVISRGGVGTWYRGVSDQYLDVLDYYELDEFRARNEERIQSQRGALKQWTVTRFDRHIIDRLSGQLGTARPALLHPSLMYRLFLPFWLGHQPLPRVRQRTIFQPFERSPMSDTIDRLPAEYIAIRFYFNASFPRSAENCAVIQRLIRTIADTTAVVVLNPGMVIDDHADFGAYEFSKIYAIDSSLTAGSNLGIQSAVVSRAKAFLGTYGGLAYLAPFYNVPSVSFYSDFRSLVPQHLELANDVFSELSPGKFIALPSGTDLPITGFLGATATGT
jgi:hypothetical protein